MVSYTCTQFVNFAEPLSYVNGTMSTTYTLDAARFGQRDLGLFIESLETISRIERERHERRQRRRDQKVREARIAQMQEEQQEGRCVSPTPSADEAVDEPVMYMEAKCIPYAISDPLPVSPKNGSSEYDLCASDEAYSSANQSPRNSVAYSSCTGLDSDSAESGVYAGTPPPLRPRSQVITKPKNRTTRSRIISMVLKREYAKAPSEPETLNHAEEDQRTEHLLNSTIKHQYDKLSAKSRRGIAYEQNSPEERFLDKALRYLTL